MITAGVCAVCGAPIAGDAGICAGHIFAADVNWAVSNRVMCDFIHRGKVPPPPARLARDDEPIEPHLCEFAIP